jgi:hypothetical protein
LVEDGGNGLKHVHVVHAKDILYQLWLPAHRWAAWWDLQIYIMYIGVRFVHMAPIMATPFIKLIDVTNLIKKVVCIIWM